MSRRARTALAVVGGVLAAVALAGVALLFGFRDRATTLDEEGLSATLVTGAGRPGDYGLYTYLTTGFESTDAVTGSRHDYPAVTHLTIQPGGCGTLVRWQPLEERYDEWDYCPDGRMAGWDSYYEWFRFGNTDQWRCAEPVRVQGESGETWQAECLRPESPNAAGAAQRLTYRVVGYETLAVGTEQVETLHVQVAVVGTGGSVSQGQVDTWYLVGTHLPVRRVSVHDSVTESRIGAVQYHEEAEILLASLAPGG